MNFLVSSKLWLLVSFPILLNMLGCSDGGGTQPQAATTKDILVDLTAMEDASDSGSKESIEKKIIKTGRLTFETDDLNKTRSWVAVLIKKHGGSVSSEREDNYSERLGQNIAVRVPVKSFDKLVQDISEGVTRLESKDISSQDVTEEFIDVEARLKTKKALEARYIDLLKQAKNVTEVVSIEKQIGDLRGEIESIEGRLKYLQNQVAYSILDIYFYQKKSKSLFLGQKLTSGLKNGWDNLLLFFVGLVNLWPFVIIGAGLVWFFVKRRRAKRSN